MDFPLCRALLEAHPWRYAKTMPQVPHFYTLRKQWTDDSVRAAGYQGSASDAFEAVVRFIRTHGQDEQYGRYTSRILIVPGDHALKYWTMGYAPEVTTLINRAYVDEAYRHGEGKPR